MLIAIAIAAARLAVLSSVYGDGTCEWEWSPVAGLFVSTHADPATGMGDADCPPFPVEEAL